MLTSLHIETPQYSSKFTEFLSKLRGDTLKVDVVNADFVEIKRVSYICRTGRINYKKLDKVVGTQRNRLICSEKVKLDANFGYKRFENSEYRRRLCTNLAIKLLEITDDNELSVGIVDMDASATLLPKYLLKFLSSITVVTDRLDVYTEVAQQVLGDIGAPIVVTKSKDVLRNCDLVIAPYGIDSSYAIKSGAVVLTDTEDKNLDDCILVYDYSINLSDSLVDVCPKCVDYTYFAAALYTMGRVYTLGSKVPSLCMTRARVHTIYSLKKQLIKSKLKT